MPNRSTNTLFLYKSRSMLTHSEFHQCLLLSNLTLGAGSQDIWRGPLFPGSDSGPLSKGSVVQQLQPNRGAQSCRFLKWKAHALGESIDNILDYSLGAFANAGVIVHSANWWQMQVTLVLEHYHHRFSSFTLVLRSNQFSVTGKR